MTQTDRSHPYRSPDAVPAAAQLPRHIPPVVRLNLLVGGGVSAACGCVVVLGGLILGMHGFDPAAPRSEKGDAVLLMMFFVAMIAFLLSMIVRVVGQRRRSIRLLERGRVTYGTPVEKRSLPLD